MSIPNLEDYLTQENLRSEIYPFENARFYIDINNYLTSNSFGFHDRWVTIYLDSILMEFKNKIVGFKGMNYFFQLYTYDYISNPDYVYIKLEPV